MFATEESRDETAGQWITRRIAWIVLVWLALLGGADADLWGHLRFGLDFLRDWHLPAVDPYLYTQDIPWVNHEWLSEAATAAAYSAGGTAGLLVYKALLVCTAFAVALAAFRAASPLVGEAFTLLLAFGTLPLTMSVRPQLWSFALLAVLLRLTVSENRHRLWLIPLVFVVWVNTHGGWIVGLAVFGLWLLGEVWRARRIPRTLLAIAAATLLATLVNPYGWGLWLFIARTVRLSRIDVEEWQPIWSQSWLVIGAWLIGTLLVVACVARARTRPRMDVLVTLVGLGYAAQRVRRLTPLFLECAILLLAPSLTRLVEWPASPRRILPPATLAGQRRINALFLAGFIAFACYSVFPHVTCLAPLPRSKADVVAAAALRSPTVRGRLAVEFDWGQYAIWHFGPRLLVSLDGRRETIYSPGRLKEQWELAAGSADGLAVLERDRPEYLWMRTNRSTLAGALPQRGYRIDVRTPDSFIAVRDDLPPLPPTPSVSRGCFPDS